VEARAIFRALKLHVTVHSKRVFLHHRALPNPNLTTCLSEAHSGVGEAVDEAAIEAVEAAVVEVLRAEGQRDRLSDRRRKTFLI
jgi:hypothetical protein